MQTRQDKQDKIKSSNYFKRNRNKPIEKMNFKKLLSVQGSDR